ncbi:YcxB family protein [Clostridium frigidicarnis]|uniref:YcxB-like protein n=1 Tax=Clostridium frigidicarnis TaxID=84698 RepID=A0A1I1AJ73_9CLOT|nr:YcxB family protein [Clostridium frigidicarnis]SFB37977.1 hypothetical protein SAMN04488528_103819 [Clostridium frigidicarnis]
MEIKFKNHIQYNIDFNRHLTKNSKFFRFREKFFICLPLIAIIFCAIIFQDSWHKTPLLTILIELGIGLIGVLIASKLFPWLSNKSARSYLSGMPEIAESINSTTTIILTDNEIIKKGISSQCKVPWSSIEHLIVEDEYIYIHARIECFQIPLVAFNSSKEKSDFIKYINKKISIYL